MRKRRAVRGDVICPGCGQAFYFDEGRRCWKCDGHACAHCLPGPEPLCEECRDDFPRHLEPMLAAPSGIPADQAKWGFEFKWDGVRALCYWDGSRLRLESRNLINITH